MECIINVHYDQFWFSLNWNVQAIWASDINKGRLSCRNSDNHWRVITWWKNLRGVVSTKCQLYWEIIIPKWEVVKRQDLMKSFLKVCLASWRFSTSGPLYQWDQLLLSGERCFWRLLDQEQAGCGRNDLLATAQNKNRFPEPAPSDSKLACVRWGLGSIFWPRSPSDSGA